MVCNVGVWTIDVATLLVGLPASYHISSLGFPWLDLFSESESRREASFFQRVLWLPWAHVSKNVILSRRRVVTRRDARRRFASVVSCGFPGSFSLPMTSWVGVATLGVALLVSWYPWGRECWVGFATTGVLTLGVDLPASCLVLH
jgi:hypothetical protein